MKIVVWNVLTPGLMTFFWRSSYGLKLDEQGDRNYYKNVHRKRIDNIVDYLQIQDADIILLQEVTAEQYGYLEGLSIQNYIGNKLGYVVVSESIKPHGLTYDYPPNEQNKDGKCMTEGVATLLKAQSPIKFIRSITNGNEINPDFHDKEVESTFTFDQFEIFGFPFYVINTHIKMQYPHIKLSLDQLWKRVESRINNDEFQNLIVGGDFNAGRKEAAYDLAESPFSKYLLNDYTTKNELDHIFYGKNFMENGRTTTTKYDTDVPILEMNVNKPPVGIRWTVPNTKYVLSDKNNKLVEDNIATTDHVPIVFNVFFQTGQKLAQAGGNNSGYYQKYLKYKTKYLGLKRF